MEKINEISQLKNIIYKLVNEHDLNEQEREIINQIVEKIKYQNSLDLSTEFDKKGN